MLPLTHVQRIRLIGWMNFLIDFIIWYIFQKWICKIWYCLLGCLSKSVNWKEYTVTFTFSFLKCYASWYFCISKCCQSLCSSWWREGTELLKNIVQDWSDDLQRSIVKKQTIWTILRACNFKKYIYISIEITTKSSLTFDRGIFKICF